MNLNFKEGTFVVITTEDSQNNKTTYSGLVSYTSDKMIGFSKAAKFVQHANGKSYVFHNTHFSIDKSWVKEYVEF